MRRVRVAARLTQRAPLAEQVPALVELDLEVPEAGGVLARKPVTGGGTLVSAFGPNADPDEFEHLARIRAEAGAWPQGRREERPAS